MFPPFGFSIQECFICFFLGQKAAFVCEFQHTPLKKLMILSRFLPLVGMTFCGNVPNSRRNKNPKRHILYLLKEVVFLAPKILLSPFCRGKKNISSTLNVLISQIVRNESVRFGRHIDIQVSYKIL